jgi:hypothetical protein
MLPRLRLKSRSRLLADLAFGGECPEYTEPAAVAFPSSWKYSIYSFYFDGSPFLTIS